MNLIKIHKEFWNPRFTTNQMEISHTSCNAKFEIFSIIYDDKFPKLPFRALGYIITNLGVKRRVSWNQFGECYFELERVPKYDLIHPDHKEIESAKVIFVCLIGIALTLWCTILWN